LAARGFRLEHAAHNLDYGGRPAWALFYRGSDCKVQLCWSDRNGGLTYFLAPIDAPNELGLINERFLRTQLENHVGRIDYMLDAKYTSLEHMAFDRFGSFSSMEVQFLKKYAPDYGYERAGNSWVYVGGRK